MEVLWDGDGVPPEKDIRPVEVLWDGDGVPPPCEKTDTCENGTCPSYYVCRRNHVGMWMPLAFTQEDCLV